MPHGEGLPTAYTPEYTHCRWKWDDRKDIYKCQLLQIINAYNVQTVPIAFWLTIWAVRIIILFNMPAYFLSYFVFALFEQIMA